MQKIYYKRSRVKKYKDVLKKQKVIEKYNVILHEVFEISKKGVKK